MNFDAQRFKALVHYIIWRTSHRDGFGATKLNKVLWFSDARAYLLHRKPITGATYIREKYGPVPQQIMPVRTELERDGIISVREEPYFGKKITRFSTREKPNTAIFSPEELQIVDWWIKHVAEDHTAESVSELSHDYMWEIAELGEQLPLYAVFATRIRAPQGKELEWAKAEAKRLGLT